MFSFPQLEPGINFHEETADSRTNPASWRSASPKSAVFHGQSIRPSACGRRAVWVRNPMHTLYLELNGFVVSKFYRVDLRECGKITFSLSNTTT